MYISSSLVGPPHRPRPCNVPHVTDVARFAGRKGQRKVVGEAAASEARLEHGEDVGARRDEHDVVAQRRLADREHLPDAHVHVLHRLGVGAVLGLRRPRVAALRVVRGPELGHPPERLALVRAVPSRVQQRRLGQHFRGRHREPRRDGVRRLLAVPGRRVADDRRAVRARKRRRDGVGGRRRLPRALVREAVRKEHLARRVGLDDAVCFAAALARAHKHVAIGERFGRRQQKQARPARAARRPRRGGRGAAEEASSRRVCRSAARRSDAK
mmetsp:Transcript_6667/g.19653  ORF Transcript_6667/g.19653 Transcript_6667/m.19653 type:complete len:270 (-) Transcript_6667:201-1010(-)